MAETKQTDSEEKKNCPVCGKFMEQYSNRWYDRAYKCNNCGFKTTDKSSKTRVKLDMERPHKAIRSGSDDWSRDQ